MPSLNRVEIIGNVGTEVEMKFTPSGKAVATFSVATNSTYKKDGETKETTEWFNIVTWNKTAEICNQYLAKGQQVYVEGKLQTRKWEGQDGVKHYRTEVVAQRVIFFGGKKTGGEMAATEVTDTILTEPEDAPF